MDSVSSPKQFPKFLKHNSFELLLFGWVKGINNNLPSVSVEKRIDQFYKFFEISETDFIKKTAARILIQRMEEKYYEMLKTDK